MDTMMVSMSKKAYPSQKKEWNLLPAPSMAVATPMIGDEVYPLMKSGFATPVSGISRITGPREVTLRNGQVLSNIDAIIQCSGYLFDVPKCIPPEFHPYPVPDKEPYLYRNIFPLHPDPAVRNSLAFLGQAVFAAPAIVQLEMYGLAISQIWQGKCKLPPLDEMKTWHAENLNWRNSQKQKYKFPNYYAVFLRVQDMFPWVDETAGVGLREHISWTSIRAWKLWWEDPKFYKIVTSGLFTPTIWRLFDMGKRKAWSGAKEQILKDNELAERRAKERVELVKKKEEEGKRKTEAEGKKVK
jgi:dimethylaniline monooxygenase (N-oxide forming)